MERKKILQKKLPQSSTSPRQWRQKHDKLVSIQFYRRNKNIDPTCTYESQGFIFCLCMQLKNIFKFLKD